eukprot:scaffold5517_cov135-Cylindrotheca_fusiformis.AAC.13
MSGATRCYGKWMIVVTTGTIRECDVAYEFDSVISFTTVPGCSNNLAGCYLSPKTTIVNDHQVPQYPYKHLRSHRDDRSKGILLHVPIKRAVWNAANSN